MDSFLQQSIMSEVTSAVAIAVAAIQAKHENEMLSLRKMIGKSLFLKNSPFAISLLKPDAILKAQPGNDSLPKIRTKRWNQVDLRYFDLHLDRAYGDSEIVLVGKNVYYRNVVLFV